MPKKRICSDKDPLGKNEEREKPGVCFKKGIKAGFAAGINKGRKGGRKFLKRATNLASQLGSIRGVSDFVIKNTEPVRKNTATDFLRAYNVKAKTGAKARDNQDTLFNALKNKEISRAGIIFGKGKCSA